LKKYSDESHTYRRDAESAGMELNKITEDIIGAAMDVHKAIGPGLLESAYEECLCHELQLRNLRFQRQVSLPVKYKNVRLDCGYRIDILVAGAVIVELKAIERIEPIHKAQILTYLKLSECSVGLLINFNVPVLNSGIQRIVNDFREDNSAFSASLR
jgi:GxxExxY protein